MVLNTGQFPYGYIGHRKEMENGNKNDTLAQNQIDKFEICRIHKRETII